MIVSRFTHVTSGGLGQFVLSLDRIDGSNHYVFSADATVRVETIADAVRLGRYMIRSPIVLERLNWDDERAEVTYQARPKRSKGPSGGIARWDVLEFIARVTDHIPGKAPRVCPCPNRACVGIC